MQWREAGSDWNGGGGIPASLGAPSLVGIPLDMIPLLGPFLCPRHRSESGRGHTVYAPLGPALTLLQSAGWCRDTPGRGPSRALSPCVARGPLGPCWLVCSRRSLHRPLWPSLPGYRLISLCLAIHLISRSVENLSRKEEWNLLSPLPHSATYPLLETSTPPPTRWGLDLSVLQHLTLRRTFHLLAGDLQGEQMTTSSVTPPGVS